MVDSAYTVWLTRSLRAQEDWEDDNHTALLLTGAVTFNPDHATVSAVVAANTEASDGSYGRIALTTETVTQDDANDRAELDCATIDFGALDNETPTAMVIFHLVTNDADSIPVALYETGFGSPTNGAGFTVAFPNNVGRLANAP
jgi:hypothetical protein